MAYIITGATGHIGNNIARCLIDDNKEVTILTRRIDSSINNLQAKIVVGDIFDKKFLTDNITSEDIVIHLAGVIDIKNNQKEKTMNINFEGTKTILDICVLQKVKRFIYFSTVDCIYKYKDEVIAEPTNIYPEKFSDNYSYSKALATKYVMDIRNMHYDMKINILYPSAVIGTNDYKPSSIGKVVKDIIEGKMQFGIKGGYNFVDVEDIAKVTLKILNNEVEGDFLLTGRDVSIYEFYDIVNKHLGRKKKTLKIPTFLVYPFIPFVPYLSKFVIKTINENHNYDNSKLKNVLEYELTSFDNTIEKTIQFFLNNKQ